MSDIDGADYKTILQHRGKIVGYSKYVDINSIVENIFNPLYKEISIAKGIILEFDISKNDPHFPFNILMETLYHLSNDDVEFISSTNEVEDMKKGFCFCKIIITGV